MRNERTNDPKNPQERIDDEAWDSLDKDQKIEALRSQLKILIVKHELLAEAAKNMLDTLRVFTGMDETQSEEQREALSQGVADEASSSCAKRSE